MPIGTCICDRCAALLPKEFILPPQGTARENPFLSPINTKNPLGVSWFWWLLGGGILWYKYKYKKKKG